MNYFEPVHLLLFVDEQYFPDGGKRAHELLDQSIVGEELKPLTKWLLEESGPIVKEITNMHELWMVICSTLSPVLLLAS